MCPRSCEAFVWVSSDVRRHRTAGFARFHRLGSAWGTGESTLDSLVKLWRPGQDIATHATAIREGKTYPSRSPPGPAIRVYLDGATSPVIDTVDSAYANGRFGLDTFANVTVS